MEIGVAGHIENERVEDESHHKIGHKEKKQLQDTFNLLVEMVPCHQQNRLTP